MSDHNQSTTASPYNQQHLLNSSTSIKNFQSLTTGLNSSSDRKEDDYLSTSNNKFPDPQRTNNKANSVFQSREISYFPQSKSNSSPKEHESRTFDIGRYNTSVNDRAPTLSCDLAQARKIWRGYLWGQLANVGKAALWWSTFGVLSTSLLDSGIALAACRGPFNIALLISSPMAVSLAERISIRKLLLATTCGRFILWSFFIPFGWLIINNYFSLTTFFWYFITGMMFIDGIQVAFSNAVDIDCGGLDSLSAEYNMPLTETLQYKFNTIHQLFFDSSFIFLTPPVALLFCFFAKEISRIQNLPSFIASNDHGSLFVLMMGVALVFGILSLTSLMCYFSSIPKLSQSDVGLSPKNNIWRNRTLLPSSSEESFDESEKISLMKSYRSKVRDVMDGCLILSQDSPLKWRLVLLAMETALEDSVVSVVIPLMSLKVTETVYGSVDKTSAALCSVSAIAVGKLGGVVAGMYMSNASPRVQQCEENEKGCKKLFILIILSSLSLILLPVGYTLMIRNETVHPTFNYEVINSEGLGSHWRIFSGLLNAHVLGPVAVLLGVFFFFVFSTAPKIGFATLIQNLVTTETVAAKVFGFVGLIVTITDAVLITVINLVFYLLGPERFLSALWVLLGLYLAHGVIELTIGPKLILRHANDCGDHQHLHENDRRQSFSREELFIRMNQQILPEGGMQQYQNEDY